MNGDDVARVFAMARRGDALKQMPDAEFMTPSASQQLNLITLLKANTGSIAFWDEARQRIVVRTDQGLQFLT